MDKQLSIWKDRYSKIIADFINNKPFKASQLMLTTKESDDSNIIFLYKKFLNACNDFFNTNDNEEKIKIFESIKKTINIHDNVKNLKMIQNDNVIVSKTEGYDIDDLIKQFWNGKEKLIFILREKYEMKEEWKKLELYFEEEYKINDNNLILLPFKDKNSNKKIYSKNPITFYLVNEYLLFIDLPNLIDNPLNIQQIKFNELFNDIYDVITNNKKHTIINTIFDYFQPDKFIFILPF